MPLCLQISQVYAEDLQTDLSAWDAPWENAMTYITENARNSSYKLAFYRCQLCDASKKGVHPPSLLPWNFTQYGMFDFVCWTKIYTERCVHREPGDLYLTLYYISIKSHSVRRFVRCQVILCVGHVRRTHLSFHTGTSYRASWFANFKLDVIHLSVRACQFLLGGGGA